MHKATGFIAKGFGYMFGYNLFVYKFFFYYLFFFLFKDFLIYYSFFILFNLNFSAAIKTWSLYSMYRPEPRV